jgi:hypothetical protein
MRAISNKAINVDSIVCILELPRCPSGGATSPLSVDLAFAFGDGSLVEVYEGSALSLE